MFAAAQKTDLEWFGFSEHSPLPSGYACGLYRHGDLSGVFPEYAREVMELRHTATRPKVLFGMELDWIPSRRDFMETLVAAYPFDYVIGGLHYLGLFSIGSGDWNDGETARFARYDAYYEEMADMAASGLVDVVAHPDFIKLHSFDSFHRWLKKPESLRRVERALMAMVDAGVAMELSSAGLRRAYREAHPAPAILKLAAAAGVTRHLWFGFPCRGYHRERVPCPGGRRPCSRLPRTSDFRSSSSRRHILLNEAAFFGWLYRRI